MERYSIPSVRLLAASIAQKVGVSANDASILADSLVDADVHGIGTHGVSRLNIYIRRIQRGLINARVELTLQRSTGGILVVDAGNGLGQVQACKVLDMLVPLAKTHGVAAATICNSQHFGALSYYCNKAAQQNMILLATTNCEPAMSPEGACEAFFGTNPVAASFPTGKEFPIKIDLATSLIARGRIIEARRSGTRIPEGWALDLSGHPTTDPAKALEGTLLTMAGAKGYALALLVEVLSGVLSGSAVGPAVGSMYKEPSVRQNVGHFFCLLNIAAFMDVDQFKSRIDQMVASIKSCKKRPGVKEILVPGERSHRRAKENQALGIGISKLTVDELETLARELKVDSRLEPSPAVEESPACVGSQQA
jgi:LDH2 family malate/lactate/ureidoglycolate dehydrogenase